MEDLDAAYLAQQVAAGAVVMQPGGRIEAALIRSLCVDRDGVDPRGIRLRGLHIAGILDLTAVDVPFALRFEACTFEAAPILHGAQVRELALVDCPRLPGLLANGIAVQGDLNLSGSHIDGCEPTSASNSRKSAVWLCESTVGGRWLCRDTTIEPHGERAIQADRMRVGGTVRLHNNFHATGELRLVGLRVSGSLDLAGARVESAGLALDLADAAIDGNLYVTPYAGPEGRPRRAEINGRIHLSSTRIDGKLLIQDAMLVRPETDRGRYSSPRHDGKALVGMRLFVGAELSIEGSTTVVGGIDLSSAELGHLRVEPGTSIDAPGQTALDLTNAEIRSTVSIRGGVRLRGTTLLVGARVRGRLDLEGAILTDPDGHSLLKADGATTEGDVELRRVHATGGQLKFWRTNVGGGVDAAGAVVDNPHGGTVRLHHCTVGGSVRLVDGFSSTGCVVLSRTDVGGRLDLGGGRFHCPDDASNAFNPEGAAIRAMAGNFRGGMDLGWAEISPAVNVTDSETTVLQDDPSTWPSRIYIAGFKYERFDSPRGGEAGRRIWDWQQRRAWLHRQREYDAGPYEQAARVFRQHGYVLGAEQLLIAQRRDGRRAEGRHLAEHGIERIRTRITSAMDWVFDRTVGYGFRPGRVLWLLAALLALVTATLVVPGAQNTMRASDEGIVFTTAGPLHVDAPAYRLDACGGGQVRCFNPLLYAVDTVVPLIALDQRDTWYPDRFVAGGWLVEWWLNMATVAGWLLSSIFLLSFARLARNT